MICKFCNAVCDNEWTQRVHHACCCCHPASDKGTIPYSLMPVIGELMREETWRLGESSLNTSLHVTQLERENKRLTARLAAAEAAAKTARCPRCGAHDLLSLIAYQGACRACGKLAIEAAKAGGVLE